MQSERQPAGLDWSEGAVLPERDFPPLSRTMLALYAGGSGDHNPLHIDSDFARSVAGMDDVIGHGMLTMALAARYVTELASARSLRAYSMRFLGMSKVGDRLVCRGRVARVFEEQDVRYAQLDLQVARTGSEVLASGTAVVAIGDR